MISSIDAAAATPGMSSYVAIAALITIGTGSFVDPRKGTLYKWLYWVIVPLADIALMIAGTRSVLAGVALGSIFILILFAGYVRYNFDKK